jgi:serine/threonine-protein kinase HipA
LSIKALNHGKNGTLLHVTGGTTLAPLYDVVPVFLDRNVTHQFAFRHGEAEFAEDFTLDNFRRLLVDLGFGKPQINRALKQTATLAKAIAAAAAELAPKDLADGLHAQAKVVEAALGADFGLPVRGLCCANRSMAGLPLIPDRPILRPL